MGSEMCIRDRVSLSGNIVVMLEELHIISINNESWRSANIIIKLQGIEITCLITHQLPYGERGNGS